MYDPYLAHYGIKGMKWGVRRKARKDAKEYARAKMYYGEGAGTRRKLINATVKERSKNPDYKSEFDKALSKQDMSKHASAAKRERKVKDTKNAAGRMGRGLVNAATGNLGRASAAAIVTYAALHYTGTDKIIANQAKKAVNTVIDEVGGRVRSKKIVDEMLRNARRR